MSAEVKGKIGKIVFVDAKCEGTADNGRSLLLSGLGEALKDPDVGLIIADIKCGCKGIDADSADNDNGPAVKKGPSNVNSEAFREGWERVFGDRKNKKDLN